MQKNSIAGWIGDLEATCIWLLFAVASAVFVGATAILAKVGIRGVNAYLATPCAP